MKQIEIEVLGVKVPWDISADSGEMNSLANVKDAEGNLVDTAHERAANYTLYHQVYGDLRDLVTTKIVEKAHKLEDGTILKPFTEQKTRTKKDGSKVPYEVVVESDGKFVERAKAVGAVTDDDIRRWLTEARTNSEYAWSAYLAAVERHVKVKSLPKAIEAKVAEFVTQGVLADKAARLSEKLGKPVDGADATAVGWALKEWTDLCAARAASEV